ncbi:MAG: glycosyltransferase family 9 protein, partial [Chthoniobacterales bacterium]
MGDVVHALPVAHAIKAACPEQRLTWVIDRRWAPLLDGVPCVDRIVEFPRTDFRGALGWLRAMAWFGKLSAYRADVAIDLQGLMRSGLMVAFSRSRDSIGLSDAREGAARLVRRTADVSRCRHAVDRYLQVLPLCGIEIPETPVFPLGQGVVPFGCPEGAVVIHPFARGEGKSMSASVLAELCRALAPHAVVLCGQGAVPSNLGAHVADFSNRTTLPELIGILRSARTVISVDSGPMHIAAALG